MYIMEQKNIIPAAQPEACLSGQISAGSEKPTETGLSFLRKREIRESVTLLMQTKPGTYDRLDQVLWATNRPWKEMMRACSLRCEFGFAVVRVGIQQDRDSNGGWRGIWRIVSPSLGRAGDKVLALLEDKVVGEGSIFQIGDANSIGITGPDWLGIYKKDVKAGDLVLLIDAPWPEN